jgi:uncharacterized membrane protein YbhN (UPF0104 family)
VLGVVAFGVTVPSTPGYFGVIQACFTMALALFTGEGDKENVFAASVYFHLSQYFPVTALGLIFLAWSGFRMSDMKSAADAEQSHAADSPPGDQPNAIAAST